MLDAIYAWVVANPFAVFMALLILMQLKQRMTPFPQPVEGEKTKSVSSLKDLREQLKEAAASREVVVIDFYATWCPPCRAAAPVYGAMSKAYAGRARFLKVDVDKAKDVAAEYSISAMPTFKVVRDAAVVGSVRGWSEASLRAEIDKALGSGSGAQQKDCADGS